MTLYRNVSQLCRLSGVSRSACYNTIEKMLQPFNRLAVLNSLADTLKAEAEGRKEHAGNKAR